MPGAAFEIGTAHIVPGSRQTVNLPVSVLSDGTPVTLSVHVVHGRRPGPTLFVSAAVHGDEVIGVEIARRLLRSPRIDAIRGTLLVVPIVNTFGFLHHARYLPDRRDLNRSFPGSGGGSLAARLANLFMTELAERSDFGIDLHSAAVNRTNLPQVRISPSSDRTVALADAFGAPIVISAGLREGSLRQTAQACGVDILLYEAGEGLRFDELSARAGVAGILRVMHALEMISQKGVARARAEPMHASSTSWTRAPAGGLVRLFKGTGEYVSVDDLLGVISDPFGEEELEVRSATAGVVIGRTNLPVVNEGDALYHVAEIADPEPETTIGHLTRQLGADPMFDEDEII